jgi:hypothetical protein
VVLGGERDAVVHGPRAVLAHDLLLGHVQAHPAALALERHAPLADLGEHGAHVAGDVLVGVLRGAAHLRADDLGAGEDAAPVEVERPQDRGPPLAGQQARRALGQHGRVQRRLAVGGIDGHGALVALAVERPAGLDERADVGDRVRDPVPVAAARDVERLVEVTRAGRVDGDER